jgi:multidrug efflux pump subunit AcrB
LALSLAVGLLVDDAIVVRENIFRHLELGEAPEEAAEQGTKEVALAVIATTAVVIAIFGPIAFLDGIVGQFFKQFGLTIVFAVSISLFDALTVGPMLSAAWATSDKHNQGTGPVARMLKAFDRFQIRLENIYENALRFTIRRPAVVLAASAAIFFASLLLTAGIPKTFLPQADNGEFEVRLEKPPGTSLDAMAQATAKIDEELRNDPTVEYTAAVSGNTNSESNKSSIYVHLKPSKERHENTSEVKSRVRDQLAKYSSEMDIKVTDYDAFGGGMRPFNLNISGENLDQLSAYAEKLAARMKKIPGLVDVDTNYRAGKPELQVIFDRAKAESLGVPTASAGAELRARTAGVVAATYRENGNEYDIRVRLDEAHRDLRKEFDTTLLPNVNYNMIPLRLVAKAKEASGYSQINRMNKARYIQISGDLGKGGALGSILDQTREIVTHEMPPPHGVTWAFFGQAQDFMDLMQNMVIAIGLGVIFIYLVLSSLYESFIVPFTILLALPFAMTGALAALFITQAGISIFSMIGIVMLLGVVTKNSILMVDYTLQLSREGLSRPEALTKAAKTRLRPILMTSLALIAGTIPIAIGLNEASKQRTAMGIAIIGGLVTSTLLTLIVVPAAYGYVDDFRNWIGRKLRRAQGKVKKNQESERARLIS